MKNGFQVWFKFAENGRYSEHGGVHDTLGSALAATHLGDPAEAYSDISAWRETHDGKHLILNNEITAGMGRSSTPWMIAKIEVPENDADRITLAANLAFENSFYDGDHHKMWVIDQMLRVLLGDRYDAAVARFNADVQQIDDLEFDGAWDIGVAP